MPSRSLVRPAALCAAALVFVAPVVASAKEPPVPPVTEIPVAPAPRSHRSAASGSASTPSTTTTTVTTTTVTTPSLAVVATAPESPAPAASPEAKPSTPAPSTSAAPVAPAAPSMQAAAGPLRVVLVDEAPSRASRTHARELPDPDHADRSGDHAGDHADKPAHHKHGRHGRPFHPAPGIVVDVTGAQGAASADLQRVARNLGYWPFRHCYEEGLERNQQLGGAVRFGIVREDGATSTQLVESTVKDESVTLCVMREARRLELPWAAAGASGNAAASAGDSDGAADFKVSLATGDEPVPTPRAIPHADELREALRASFPAVEQCYSAALSKHPDAGGRMELRFRTKSDGEVLEVSEEEPRFADVDVTRCVLGVYRTSKLPRLHSPRASRFDYALHFEAAPPRADGGTAPPSAGAK